MIPTLFVLLPELACLSMLARSKQTTPLSQLSSGFVTVTHRYHPLCGQKVEVIRVRRGLDPDLIILHPDGFHTAIAMSCTDAEGLPPLSQQALDHPVLLDMTGLCQMAHFIDNLQNESDRPSEERVRESGVSGL